ncbi:hypothetical protein AV530_016188 [Patagioenas fasciata monilis]|uniref:Uncharacterized protein n=1 Tax=Patagioenas fasciata monilis TaxID=372326 RepID=A0A1V4JWG1_PATFA|nr:hypothetical protein AV530_016188 [Patagioenas fasciata monilis]
MTRINVGRAELHGGSSTVSANPCHGGRADLLGTSKSSQERTTKCLSGEVFAEELRQIKWHKRFKKYGYNQSSGYSIKKFLTFKSKERETLVLVFTTQRSI